MDDTHRRLRGKDYSAIARLAPSAVLGLGSKRRSTSPILGVVPPTSM